MDSTPRENAALVRTFLTDIIAGGDTDALGIFVADDAVDHHPSVGMLPGVETASPGCSHVLAAADIDVTIDAIVAAEEKVAIRGTVTGIHRESLVDLVPTGRSFEIPVAWFCRIEDGRIAEMWSLPDGLELMRQLDAIPEAGLNSPQPI